MDDSLLIEGLRAGDERAFETIVRTYGGRLVSVARRMLHSEEDARDTVHETFLKAFRSRESLSGNSPISEWLHAIGVEAALAKLGSRARTPEEAIEDYMPRFLPGGLHAETFAAWPESVDVALARPEIADMVRQAIEALPETYRTVVLLRDVEGLSRDETARIVKTTPAAVKIRLHRGRMALRTLFAPHLAGGSS